MPLVLALGSGRNTLSMAAGWWGGAQRCPIPAGLLSALESTGQEERAPSGHRFGCSGWNPSNAHPHAAEGWHDGQGRATGSPSKAGWWLPLLTGNCCPAPNELGKKSGFGRWTQHQVELLLVPHLRRGGGWMWGCFGPSWCDVALPMGFPSQPHGPQWAPAQQRAQAWHAGAHSSPIHSGQAFPSVPPHAAHAVSSASSKH